MKKSVFTLIFAALGLASAQGAIVISQYYEGTGTNKWIEIFNTDLGSPVDLSTISIGHWNNANAEGYKTSVAPSFFLALSGSIAPGGYFLVGNTANTTPNYVTADVNNNSVINFNGNDSIVLYSTGTFATANIIDAIGFTNAGAEGADKSFVRVDTGTAGWNTTAGSKVTDFPTVWTEATLATVNAAASGTPERLVSSVPEPSTLITLLGGLGMLVGVRRLRGSYGSTRRNSAMAR